MGVSLKLTGNRTVSFWISKVELLFFSGVRMSSGGFIIHEINQRISIIPWNH